MYKSFHFILLGTILLFFTQCKDASSTKEEITQKAKEVVEKPVEEVKETVAKIDSAKLAKPMVAANISTQKEKATPKKVAVKTDEATDRKKEPVAPKKKKKRSKIKFEQTIHKFGTIKTGDKINYKFKFINTGNAPLVIKSVDVSCGCTFPSYPFLPIEAGDEGEIDVTFDSKNKVGRQKPTVTVVTNGSPRKLKLYLEGFVE